MDKVLTVFQVFFAKPKTNSLDTIFKLIIEKSKRATYAFLINNKAKHFSLKKPEKSLNKIFIINNLY